MRLDLDRVKDIEVHNRITSVASVSAYMSSSVYKLNFKPNFIESRFTWILEERLHELRLFFHIMSGLNSI